MSVLIAKQFDKFMKEFTAEIINDLDSEEEGIEIVQSLSMEELWEMFTNDQEEKNGFAYNN